LDIVEAEWSGCGGEGNVVVTSTVPVLVYVTVMDEAVTTSMETAAVVLGRNEIASPVVGLVIRVSTPSQM